MLEFIFMCVHFEELCFLFFAKNGSFWRLKADETLKWRNPSLQKKGLDIIYSVMSIIC